MTEPSDHSRPGHIPEPGEPSVPELELDENVAPRPEEEIADVLRAEPDLERHGGRRDELSGSEESGR